jgi:phenylacetate-CoA ligase
VYPTAEVPVKHHDRFEKLKGLLLARNQFYGERLKSAHGFSDIPFTTKTDLLNDQLAFPPFGSNLTFSMQQYVRMHQTSGTSGKPLVWLDTIDSWNWWLRCWAEVYRAAGVVPGDRVFFPFSFGPFIGFWTAFEAAQKLGIMVLSGGGQSTEQRVHSIFEKQATVVVCTPTYALRLAEIARSSGRDIAASSIRITIHAGEPGASVPATRKRIEEAFGAKAYDHVGMTEIGAYGFECEAQSGIHINEDEFIAEVVDPVTLTAVSPGHRGELVLTNLGREGMPLIRYRTGDLVFMSNESCSCQRSSPRLIGGVLGRSDDMITIRGVNVFPSAIENIVRRHPAVVEYAIEVFRRQEMHELRLKVELDASADPVSAVASLQESFLRDLRIRTEVECVPQNSLPRFELKSRRVQIL